MIKNYYNEELNVSKISINEKITYKHEQEYTLIKYYSDIESVLLACSYFKENHFCITKTLEINGLTENDFYLFILSSEYTDELNNELMYLIDNIYNKLHKN